MYFYHGEPPYDTVKDVKNADFSDEFRAEVKHSIQERKSKGRYSDHMIEAFGGEAFWRQSAGIFLFYLHYPSPSQDWITHAADFLCSLEFKHALLKREGIRGAEVADLHWAWAKLSRSGKKTNGARQFAQGFFSPYASWVEEAVKHHHGILPSGRKLSRK